MKKNNNVTRYIYSAAGEKLRVRYFVIYTDTKRLPWENSKKIMRIKRDEME
jgi:hypothetical protein